MNENHLLTQPNPRIKLKNRNKSFLWENEIKE